MAVDAILRNLCSFSGNPDILPTNLNVENPIKGTLTIGLNLGRSAVTLSMEQPVSSLSFV